MNIDILCIDFISWYGIVQISGDCGKDGKHISTKRNGRNDVYEQGGKVKAKDELREIVGKGNGSDPKNDLIKYSWDQSLLPNKLT